MRQARIETNLIIYAYGMVKHCTYDLYRKIFDSNYYLTMSSLLYRTNFSIMIPISKRNPRFKDLQNYIDTNCENITVMFELLRTFQHFNTNAHISMFVLTCRYTLGN